MTTYSEEIPLPEEDESLIDTQYIHWGYLNCCQTVAKGKKIKREKWNTYWVELCGTTVRYFKDSSLHVESNLAPPPPSPHCILKENETKVAFFELRNADITVLPDGKALFRPKNKKTVAPKIFRRHLFQLKLRHLRNTYVFQPPSHSTMLRWVSKIQESLDAVGHEEKSSLAEQRLKLARDMMGKRAQEQAKLTAEETEVDDAFDGASVVTEVTELQDLNPTLRNLRRQLADKNDLIWQFEKQIIDFLGNKGEFKRKEFTCETKQDYLLVPGKMETFIPAGTNVTIFGQLPNRRWRCLIEMNELIKVMNELVNDLKVVSGEEPTAEKKVSEHQGSPQRDIETLENLLNNLPEYPLLGCLPSSILDFDSNSKKERTTCTDTDTGVKPQSSPESNHRISYSVSVTPSPPITDDVTVNTTGEQTELNTGECDRADESAQTLPDVAITDIDITFDDNYISASNPSLDSVDGKSPVPSESESGSENEDEVKPLGENILRNFGSGIIIRKKLRQKGLSIIVGSSSSEDEDEKSENSTGNQLKCHGVTKHVKVTSLDD